MTAPARFRGALAAGLAVLAADQATKFLARRLLEPGVPVSVLGDLVRFDLGYNTGAVFGLFASAPGAVFAVKAVTTLAFLALAVWLIARPPAASRTAFDRPAALIALGMGAAAALANFLDRLAGHGVVDFIDIGIGDLRWYTFNLADLVLVVAAVMLAGCALSADDAGDGAAAGDAGGEPAP